MDMWLRTANPNAILSTYAPPPMRLGLNDELPHICRSRFTSEGVPTNQVPTVGTTSGV